jgi:hypothetical protein
VGILLCQAVIEAILIYPIMTLSIPQACVHEIQQIQRSFIWGDDEHSRKIHAGFLDAATC